ncbi:Protein farnesyltransferase/geranylgeranyltransferase type-1 subunit alpha [Madurella mycetomatis]|uniref:Protein farnesyltransferase/geranylgeranyltransferase type-1 subunit alpha n=1 Tax=Madurella mycetomatis TaxID=100816 RepID=A0A175VQ02_9PEZI|nr:Protein farnesyltransferase/geranylgeranyltransferase type-1 subunit alpha [Madurella mycetomatis]
MPPRGKAAGKPKAAETPRLSPPTPATSTSASTTAANNPTTATITIRERSQSRFDAARPYDALLRARGNSLSGLNKAEQAAWLSARIAARLATRPATSSSVGFSGGSGTGSSSAVAAGLGLFGTGGSSNKTAREVWKTVNELGLPLRAAAVDRLGDNEAALTVEEFERRAEGKVRLACLEVESRRFRELRGRGRGGVVDTEVQQERRRRQEMAELRRELYGGGVGKDGKLALDPEWDDVVPIVLQEPEKALAAIAYPAHYAEAMAYLRAVMQAQEYSPRCLRLTEYIIDMNPAHYTVWLYRAANVFALKLPLFDEIEWLNQIALENLKNYQIWHHRHLLVENYYPAIADDPDAVARFTVSEREFLQKILAMDTKNYHVWSYRSYLVGKLRAWGSEEERQAIEAMIDHDVRNNSAWSHRFFLVFSNPEHATTGVGATQPDPKVPQAIIDREIEYTMEKIRLAPQNQSGWNYLRGVLVKGGRKLASVEKFASEFVKGLGEGEETEDVQSTHALDLLAEIYVEKGDKEKADLSLRRLGQKWDQIRFGYWEWRRKSLEAPA